jgi:hypothetical protein
MSTADTATAFSVTRQTITNRRRDPKREVPTCLPRIGTLGALAAEFVIRLQAKWPDWGTRRIAGQLARLGVKVSRSSVQRIVRRGPRDPAEPEQAVTAHKGRILLAKRPDRLLAWRVNEAFDPGVTEELLIEAGGDKLASAPDALVDGGVENMNGGIDALVERQLLRRILAMVDIRFSNSLIQAWWRSLKDNWLFLHPLDTAATVRREVGFYVCEPNSVIPHSAFKEQTPDEMYFGRGDGVPDQLTDARAEARARCMESNRGQQCAVCA